MPIMIHASVKQIKVLAGRQGSVYLNQQGVGRQNVGAAARLCCVLGQDPVEVNAKCVVGNGIWSDILP